jgi:hypothetical protein
MILFSHDAVEDVERLRTFLNDVNPGAAQRALELIRDREITGLSDPRNVD